MDRSEMRDVSEGPRVTAAARTPAPTGAAAFIAREKGRSVRGSRSLAVSAIVVIAFGAGLGVWTAVSDDAAFSNTAPAPTAAKLATLDPAAERRSEERLAAEKRDLQAKEIAENQKRISALEKRREELQKQVAELTAPLSADMDDARPEASRPDGAPDAAAAQGARSAVGEIERVDARAPADVKVAARSDDPQDAEIDALPPSALPASTASPQSDAPTASTQNGPVRVFIHVRARDPEARARAQALAEDLRRRGVDVAGIRGVPRAVRNDMVRFFYDADQNAVPELEKALGSASRGGAAPITQDFRNRRVAPKPGTLEIWLS